MKNNILIGLSLITLVPFYSACSDTLEQPLQHNQVFITTTDATGNLSTQGIDAAKFEQLQQTQTQFFKPQEKQGSFAIVKSVSEPEGQFPVHFKASDTPEVATQKIGERILFITLHGISGRGSDMGPFLSALRPYGDTMALGTVIAKNPEQDGGGFKEGSFEEFLASNHTKEHGGGFTRIVETPVKDITELLTKGVTVTNHTDGTSQNIEPYKYKTIIAVGLCMGALTFIRTQKQLLDTNKRGFDGFIMDSPLADIHSPILGQWIKQTAGLGPAYDIIPTLKELQSQLKAVPTYILWGGQDTFCTKKSVTDVLQASGPNSQLVTIEPVGHSRSMYNDNRDRNIPSALPYIHIDGCRQTQTGLMQEWLEKNFIPH